MANPKTKMAPRPPTAAPRATTAIEPDPSGVDSKPIRLIEKLAALLMTCSIPV